VASARVALFPLQWEEPGGTAIVGALALGTPTVGLSCGCLPELVEHGRTGWLAKSPDDLAALVQVPGGLTRASAVSSPQLVSGFVPED
jgi:glycosyltransferase involved in cell wall biosynthesis